MKIYVRLEAPYEWARVNANAVEAFGEVPTLAEYPIGAEDEVIGVVPGEWVTTHRVALPTKTRKQFNQALPFALEDAISEDVSNIYFICPAWRAASEVTVLSVAKDKMQFWQDLANDNRLPVAQLIPDHTLIPFHEAADCSIALIDGGTGDGTIVARHAELGGVCIDESLVDVWLMDVPIAATVAVNDEGLTQRLIAEHPNRDFRHWSFGDKMRHWLEYGTHTSIDLWGDKYRPKVSLLGKRAFIKPLAVAALALFVLLGHDVYRYYSLHSEIQKLDQKMLSTLEQVMPGVQGIEGGEARTFMQNMINRGQSQTAERSVHSTLASAASVLKRMRATLIELNYQNQELLLTCVLNDFSQVDALTKQFNAQRALTASLQGSAAEDGKIIATYSIRQRS